MNEGRTFLLLLSHRINNKTFIYKNNSKFQFRNA